MNSLLNKFQVKANLPNGEIHNFSFSPDLSWTDFKIYLMGTSNLDDIRVIYADEEGDKITLTAEDEFQDVKRSLNTGGLVKLRITVSATHNARPYKKVQPTPIPRNYGATIEKNKHYTEIAMEIGEEFRLQEQTMQQKHVETNLESNTTKLPPKGAPPEWLHPFVESASEVIAMRVLDQLTKSESYSVPQNCTDSFTSQSSIPPHPNTAHIVVHAGIICKNCNGLVTGNRYKCGNCADYDICELCLVKPYSHDETHVFLILKQSCPNAGLYNGHFRPILNQNLYLPSRKDAAKKRECLLFPEISQDQLLEKTKKKMKKDSKILKKIAKQNLPKHVQSKVEHYKETIQYKRQEIKEIREKIKETKTQHFSENDCLTTQPDIPLFSSLTNIVSDYGVLITGSSCEAQMVNPNQQFERKWVVKNNGKLCWTDVMFLCTGGTLPVKEKCTQLPRCAPDCNLEITLNFQAPPTEGSCNSFWSLSQNGKTFGPIFKTEVRVISEGGIIDKNVDVDSGAEDDVDLACVDQGYALRAFSGMNSSQQPLIATSKEDDIYLPNYNTLIDHDSIELFAGENVSDIQRPPSSLYSDTENIYDPTPCLEAPKPSSPINVPKFNHQLSDTSDSSDDSFIVVNLAECFEILEPTIENFSAIPSAPPAPAPTTEINNRNEADETECNLILSPMASPVHILSEQQQSEFSMNTVINDNQIESLTTSIRSLSSEMSDVGDNLLISQTQEPPTTEDTLINFESPDIIFQSTMSDNFTPTSTLLQDEEDKPATLFEFNPTPPVNATLSTPFNFDNPITVTPTAPYRELIQTPPTVPAAFNEPPQSSPYDCLTTTYSGEEQAFDLPHRHWKPKSPETPLENLMSMGFCNRKLNLDLLAKHKNNLSEVVAELIDHQTRAWPVNNM